MRRLTPPRFLPLLGLATCERLELGLFAQRAALADDVSAARRLSAPVFATLAADRSAFLGAAKALGIPIKKPPC
jgi:hypothetical protein